mmetsp:Transcript_47964/g.94657  ORF Transcript_47964/g.94657 Transcript_47964/m.94657 type:complete len:257 (+) Transcript_47964:582-1352(+)
MRHTHSSARSRANLCHALSEGLPLVRPRVESLRTPQPLPVSAPRHQKSGPERRAHRRASGRRQRRNVHPLSNPEVPCFNRGRDSVPVKAPHSEDPVVGPFLQHGTPAIPPGHLQRGGCNPLIPQSVVGLPLIQSPVVVVEASEHMKSSPKTRRPKRTPLSLHRTTRPPALLPDIQDFHGSKRFVSRVPTACEDEREGEKPNPKPLSLPDDHFALFRASRHRRRLRIPKKVEHQTEGFRVSVQKNPPLSVSRDEVSS